MQAHIGVGGFQLIPLFENQNNFRRKILKISIKFGNKALRRKKSTNRFVNLQPNLKKRKGVFKLCFP